MPPATRKLFVEYGLKGKKAGTPRPTPRALKLARIQLEKRWLLLNAADRAEFVKQFNGVEKARVLAAEKEVKAVDIAQQAANERKGINTDFDKFIRLSDAAAAQFDKALTAWDKLADSSHGFYGIVGNVYNADEDICAIAKGETEADRHKAWQMRKRRDACRGDADWPPGLPRRLNGVVKMFEEWVTDRSWSRWQGRKRAAFKVQPPQVAAGQAGTGWEGAWMQLGGPSSTGVFVQCDQHGNVINRIVQKDTYKDREKWASAIQFAGDVHDAQNREPFEINCHRSVAGIRSDTGMNGRVNVPSFVVPPVVSNMPRYYRMTLEYCMYGDLADLLISYIKKGPLPEPFLWRVFHCLAEVAFAMEYGHTDTTRETREEGWKQIVHRDWKPANVFLTSPTPGWFENYPTPMVGDFGAAIRTHSRDELNPDIFLESTCTPGWTAPEQRAYVDARNLQPVDNEKLLAHTNIYGVGVTMYTLIVANGAPRQPRFLGSGYADELNVVQDAPANAYSERLLQLVQACLRPRPLNRITTRNLVLKIGEAINESDRDSNFARDMPSMARNALPPNDDRRLRHLPTDKYALGLNRNQLPART